MSNGFFITFEGIDGSGKSTQSKLLSKHLSTLGHDVVQTREPGGSVGAEIIRNLLVSGDPDRWSAETEILLFTAARKDHMEKTILPAMEQGKIVVSDRFADSTRVYQGVARAELLDTVNLLHDHVIGVEPDVTFIIDSDPEKSLTRGLARDSGEDRFEELGLSFQKNLRKGFLELAQANPKRCKVINGMQEIDAVVHDIIQHIVGLLP